MERYMIPNQHEADLYQAVLARMQGKADVVDIQSRKNI